MLHLLLATVLLAVLAVGGVLLSTRHGSGGSSTASAGSTCRLGFSIRPFSFLAHGNTPQQAVHNFLRFGSINGALPFHENPVKAGAPSSGWRQIRSTGGNATFKSGADTLTVERIQGSHWEVMGGSICDPRAP
jgi:hypothetical protein